MPVPPSGLRASDLRYLVALPLERWHAAEFQWYFHEMMELLDALDAPRGDGQGAFTPAERLKRFLTPEPENASP